ncbi:MULTISPECIES: glycosyltransferase family 2 protein [Streptomyces]|uniref:Glycosyltransferase family 2 protein n=2 Tax=Streptomyces TaxID=1883 RepID=A0A3R7HMT6_9ACTN|nr:MULTISPECIES: glycosyltransferase family 2 protein [Streptomyces]MZE81221.1 glycosyltransferase [Streptomyces sp. SID5475]KNE82349.1 glycosyltransferase [Streptomyces fradiae]MCC3654426.1 glycosyltransferase family 2 protein [Streptomyces sp. S07_1.15]MCC5034727.1 glycosyltransferase family 2 protein [Streptomyces sp. WAC 00631]MCC9741906.1 glycosyltransferase family 2 protein [Streptomyces sp. MNU89]
MSAKLPIVVAIPTKNEAENIAAAVGSVMGHFEAVVVVDSDSTDDTRKIASGLGAEIVPYEWDGKYPKKKQWCLDHVRPEIPWMLFLDGDETPSPALLAELRQVFSEPVAEAAFDIPLGYWFAGQRLRHGYTIVKRALMDRNRCYFPVLGDLDAPGMGEQEGHYQPIAESVRRLRSPIEHEDLDPVRTWFDRHNRYSDWEAWLELHPEVREEIRLAKTRQGQLFHKAPFKPLVSFGYAYFYKLGFLDGRAGLDYALAMSFYRWQIGLKTREGRRTGRTG